MQSNDSQNSVSLNGEADTSISSTSNSASLQDLSIQSDSNLATATESQQPETQTSAEAQAEAQQVQSKAAAASASNSNSSSSTNPTSTLATTSLSSSIEGLVLYDLTTKKGSNQCFSPHTLKTILDLKLLGIGYERQRLTFAQIRGELSRKVADNVTVPCLELSDGTNIIESWNIAEYLESQHPKGVLLFPSTSSKVFAQFLNTFGKTVLGPNIGPLCMPQIACLVDPESADYFVNQKVGAARIEKLTKMTAVEKQNYVEGAIKALGVIDSALGTNDAVYDPDATPQEIEKRRKRGGDVESYSGNVGDEKSRMVRKWLCKGEEPSHADFVLFGWYSFTRVTGPETTKQIWQNSSNPLVKAWVNNLLQWCGKEITDDFI